VGASMLLSHEASQMHGSSHDGGTELPELCAGGALCQGWLGAILPRHRITESQNGRGWKGPLWVI